MASPGSRPGVLGPGAGPCAGPCAGLEPWYFSSVQTPSPAIPVSPSPSSIRRAVLALAFLLSPLPSMAESRHWTSSDGRTLEGEFVRATRDAVVIRRPDGLTVDIPVRLLADEDILHVTRVVQEREAAEQAEREAGERRKDKEELLEGPISYVLTDGHEDWPADRKRRIVEAMDAAVSFFNQHADFKKHLWANNSPGTPTADANYEGWINWGGSINRRVALHEISHTLGIGTHPRWQGLIKDGKWTGKHAVAQLREFDGDDAVLHADRQHFWPYGLNFDKESNPEADLRFIKMVAAFRKDLGID